MDVLGGRRVGGSGASRFLKLDGYDAGGFVYSVKAAESISSAAMRGLKKLWQETVVGTRGSAGHGDGAKPAMIFELDGELFMLCRLEDHADMAKGDIKPYIKPSKADERRARTTRSTPMD